MFLADTCLSVFLPTSFSKYTTQINSERHSNIQSKVMYREQTHGGQIKVRIQYDPKTLIVDRSTADYSTRFTVKLIMGRYMNSTARPRFNLQQVDQ